jgi:diaminohydroxyphosphoribosylaminopyrimidine deaminase/5-amino-6-(5-phosphoribosylamino)uracil reductase
MAIAPLIIGDGRPAIRLLPPSALGDCLRPRYRVFRMGGDVLFDCDLKPDSYEGEDPQAGAQPSVTRVI